MGLKQAGGFLRSQIARRIKLHSIPQLHFVYDASVERGRTTVVSIEKNAIKSCDSRLWVALSVRAFSNPDPYGGRRRR